ncbi:MAG: hypothetical protein JXK92_09625 [Erysipelotrichaceae bacterium]|nr:hypothetical protein [Erysipelotrichaceae bacterium]
MSDAPAVLKTIYIESYATDENLDAPNFAAVDLTQPLIDKITELQAITKKYGATQIRVPSSDVQWDHSTDKIEGDELVVCQIGFWFQADIGYGNEHVETRIQDFGYILGQLDDPSATYYGEDMDQEEFDELLESRRRDAENRLIP